ncbi:MAG TPA: F0F1 ATP synthase subunit B [Burkholderiaceae bacterium]|nr:F0F1 ATP synthase subunit B [Burkholderiaceae bacterium]
MNINLTLLAQALVFGLLIWFTAKFIWPPILRAMDARRKKIAEGLADAERSAKSIDEARQQVAKMQTEARTQAQNVVAEGERRGQAVIEAAKVQAKAEADRIVAAAHAEAEQAMQKAKGALRDQVAVLAVAGAEQILKREVNAQVHAQLLNELKASL